MSRSPLQTVTDVNPELQNERNSGDFNTEELCNIYDCGKDKTDRRRYIFSLVEKDPELRHRPFVFMERAERYSEAMRLATHCVKKCHELELTDPVDQMLFRQFALANAASPIGLHTVMFLPVLFNQTTPEQMGEWLPKALTYQWVGTYAQTEMGHGTFVRGLETTATYDRSTEEFVLNTPTVTSLKWWPGNLGKTTNHAVVMAQLYTKGQHCGMQPFLLQTRSLKDHKPLPGIDLGDIGPKLGYESNDNGFMKLTNVRIPRGNMLMKNAEVLPDGTFVQKKSSKLTYGVMVWVRSLIIFDMGRSLAQACTIAIRYSAIRRQSEMKPGAVEPKILDFQTQQYKLFPLLAASCAFWFAGRAMLVTYQTVQEQISQGNIDQLPELHGLSCGLKAFTSWTTSNGIEVCRMSCGGHGYSQASGLPGLYAASTPACTYEGENTVMMLQTARYLVKAFARAQSGQDLPGFVNYLRLQDSRQSSVDRSMKFDALIAAYQHRARRLVRIAATKLQKLTSQGKPQWEAWNLCSVELVKCATAHSHCYIVQNFVEKVNSTNASPPVKRVLSKLCLLYALHGIEENAGEFLEDGFMTGAQVDLARNQVLTLLADIRPNAVSLVDSFDFNDRLLDSVLGRYDGNVYENMYKWAKESPLNEKDVMDAHNKYMKPLQEYMKARL